MTAEPTADEIGALLQLEPNATFGFARQAIAAEWSDTCNMTL
jgi:hypothetical protein